jgi:fibronectin-binding autotransporter adhesin
LSGNGVWSEPSNWEDDTPAGGAGSTAWFNNLTTSTGTITLDVPLTLGVFEFNAATIGTTAITRMLAGATQTLTLDNGAAAPVFHVNNSGTVAFTLTVQSILAGANGFTKTGNGILSLTNQTGNTVSGTVSILGGRVDLYGNGGADGTAGALNTNWAGVTDWVLDNGGALRSAATDNAGQWMSAAQTLTVGAGGGAVMLNGYQGKLFGANLAGTGTLTVQSSSRIFTLSGDASLFFGDYNLVNPVQLNAAALVNDNKIYIGDTGGLVGYAGKFTTFQDWLDSGLIDTNATGALILSNNTINQKIDLTNYAGLMLGAADLATFTGTIIAANNTYRLGGGSNVLQLNRENILTGNNRLVVGNDVAGGGSARLMQANDYTGGTEITKNATLIISEANAIGSGDIISRGNLQLSNTAGMTLNVNMTTQGLPSSGDVGNIMVATAGDFVWNGDITVEAIGAGMGGAKLNLTRNSVATLTVNGDINLRGGNLSFTSYGTGINYGANIVKGVISGTNNLTKDSLSSLALNAANTFSGTLTLNGGNLIIGNERALQNATLVQTTNTGAGNDNTLLFGSGVTNVRLAGLANGWSGRSINLENTDGDAVTLEVMRGSIGDVGFSTALTGGGGLSYKGRTGIQIMHLRGANTYTGDTVVRYGVLSLDWNGNASAALSEQTRLVLAGGEFRVTPRNNTTKAQTVNGLLLEAGASKVNVNNAGSGTSTLNLGGITRESGATLDFTMLPSAVRKVTTTTTNDANGILGGYATVSGSTWAANDGDGNVVAYTGYSDDFAAGANVSVAGVKTVSGAQDINSLRLHSQATIDADDALRVASGGILMTNAAASSTINATTLTSGNGTDLIVHQNRTPQTDTLTINAVITDDGATATGIGFTKSGGGNVTLTRANTYSGDTQVNAGTLIVSTGAGLGTGDVFVAAGASLLLQDAAAIDALASLWFDNLSTAITLDFADGMTVATVGLNDGLQLSLGEWHADDLNAYFEVDIFSGSGFFEVVPEPSTWLLLGAGILTLTVLRCQKRRGA